MNKICACDNTTENLRNRADVKLAINAKDYDKLVGKPTFFSQKIFNKNLTAIHKTKVELTLNTPAYADTCILNLTLIWVGFLGVRFEVV